MLKGIAARVFACGQRGCRGRVAAVAAAAVFAILLAAQPALATSAPHVPTSLETDTCAMCHRAHTSGSDTTWTVSGVSGEATGNALILGDYTGIGDTGLCFTCHGVEALGSESSIQREFDSASAHLLMPAVSEFGPTAKQCSSCHDSHGSERDLDGDPFAALLRAYSIESPFGPSYGTDEYCGTCHLDRPQSRFDGLAVWYETAHSSEMTPPASGTGIVCVNCHEAHGSTLAPLVRSTLQPPAAPATVTIDANDRELCLACHSGTLATFSGREAYDISGHALSEATVTISGEWPSREATRTVGECQNCHAPMGRSDGDGGVIPKLVDKTGREMCDTCHSADSPAGEAAGDFAQFRFPASETTKLEVAVAYNAERLPTVFDRLALYAQETTGTLPFDLTGPREYDVPGEAADMVAADVQQDGVTQLLIADPSAKRIVMATPDPLAGVSVSEYSLTTTPTLIAVGDVFVEDSGRPELVVVSRSEETTVNNSFLYVYRWKDTSATTGEFEELAGPIALDDEASGLAVGYLGRLDDGDDIVVTAYGVVSGPSVSIYRESSATPGSLDDPPTYRYDDADGVLAGPRGPSIGDADAASAGNEIAVANSRETVDTLTLISPTTGPIASYEATVAPGAWAWDTLIADVLPGPGFDGAETVVALRNNVGASGINVFGRHGTAGLVTPPLSYETGHYFATSSLASGDVDSAENGRAELVVANAGTWAETPGGDPTPPSIQVFRTNVAGDALLTPPSVYSAGGVEKAGNTPALALADLGSVGGSRHPTSVSADPDAVRTAHVSTETADTEPFELHVECTDCHNVHEATSTPSPADATAPEVYGRLKGAWGIQVEYGPAAATTYTQRQGVLYEYEVCFKCHSGWTRTPDSGDDIAAQFDTRNPSFHSIAGGSTNASNTAGSFVNATPAWTTTSVLHCVDCHGNSDTDKPVGPHSSPSAPLLSRPLWGVSPAEETGLCYKCHKRSVYYTGVDDGTASPGSMSMFHDGTLAEPKLHKLHSETAGFSCETCHYPHGAREHEHLIRPGLDWVHLENGGACYTPCHGGSTANVYSRVAAVSGDATATAITPITYQSVSGNLASILTQGDLDVYTVQERQGNYPVLRLQVQFGGLAGNPSSFRLFGRYQGNVGHTVEVRVKNQTNGQWVVLGEIPHATVNGEYVYPLGNPAYVSGTGLLEIEIDHVTGGSATHYLYIDRAWLRY